MKAPPSSSPLWRLFRVVVAVDVRLYRLTGGRVSIVNGKPSLLLHHVGAKSGARRVTRVLHLADGDRHVIVASKGGTDRHPAWFHNLMANPDTEIEVGRERKLVHARVLDAGERDELWPRVDAIEPVFADYRRWAADAGREIQMVALEPASRPPHLSVAALKRSGKAMDVKAERAARKMSAFHVEQVLASRVHGSALAQ